MSDTLIKHREVWKNKKILRDIYTSWYKQMINDLKPGAKKTLELGAGSGNFKEFKHDSLSSDIDYSPWLDICFDAHHLPFKNNEISNIVMIDVLHHLADPILFFNEVARVLEINGRVTILEPFPSPFSLFIYKRFHPEPFIKTIDYFSGEKRDLDKNPWDSNQAMAWLLFYKYRQSFEAFFINRFRIIKRKRLSCILYPASGGFENKALVPDFSIPFFKFLETLLIPLRPLMAFRCYIVLEKIG